MKYLSVNIREMEDWSLVTREEIKPRSYAPKRSYQFTTQPIP